MTARHASAAIVWCRRSPSGTVPDLVVVLQAHDEPVHRHASGVGCRDARFMCSECWPVYSQPSAMIVASSRVVPGVVGVVAVVVTGHHACGRRGGSRRPRRRRAPSRRAAALRSCAARFRSSSACTTIVTASRRAHRCGNLLDDVLRALVDERVGGVEAQAVDVVLANPVGGVVEDEPPHVLGDPGPSRLTACPHGVRWRSVK